MEHIFLTAADTVVPAENNLVSLTRADGTVTDGLEPRRLFPVTDLTHYITLLDADGNEQALIRDLADLSEDARRTVQASLDDYYLVPKILRIVAVTQKYGLVRWTVETDRGTRTFDIRNRNHDIRVSRDGSVRVRDADDNRYLIDDYRDLDAHSRSLMIGDL